MRAALLLAAACALVAVTPGAHGLIQYVPCTGLDRPGLVRQQMLDAWNTVRDRHGARPVQWDDKLAASAQAWVDDAMKTVDQTNCAVAHNEVNLAAEEKRLGFSVGEVIDWNGFNYNGRGANIQGSCRSSVNFWAAEIQWWDFATATCQPNKVCGHFTNVVARSTKRIGCGSAQSKLNSDGTSSCTLLSCRFQNSVVDYDGVSKYDLVDVWPEMDPRQLSWPARPSRVQPVVDPSCSDSAGFESFCELAMYEVGPYSCRNDERMWLPFGVCKESCGTCMASAPGKVPPAPPPPPPFAAPVWYTQSGIEQACLDQSSACQTWARLGACNGTFTKSGTFEGRSFADSWCKVSCGKCSPPDVLPDPTPAPPLVTDPPRVLPPMQQADQCYDWVEVEFPSKKGICPQLAVDCNSLKSYDLNLGKGMHITPYWCPKECSACTATCPLPSSSWCSDDGDNLFTFACNTDGVLDRVCLAANGSAITLISTGKLGSGRLWECQITQNAKNATCPGGFLDDRRPRTNVAPPPLIEVQQSFPPPDDPPSPPSPLPPSPPSPFPPVDDCYDRMDIDYPDSQLCATFRDNGQCGTASETLWDNLSVPGFWCRRTCGTCVVTADQPAPMPPSPPVADGCTDNLSSAGDFTDNPPGTSTSNCDYVQKSGWCREGVNLQGKPFGAYWCRFTCGACTLPPPPGPPGPPGPTPVVDTPPSEDPLGPAFVGKVKKSVLLSAPRALLSANRQYLLDFSYVTGQLIATNLTGGLSVQYWTSTPTPSDARPDAAGLYNYTLAIRTDCNVRVTRAPAANATGQANTKTVTLWATNTTVAAKGGGAANAPCTFGILNSGKVIVQNKNSTIIWRAP